MYHYEGLSNEYDNNSNHLKAIELIEILAFEMEKKLHNHIKVFTNAEKERIQYVLDECKNWKVIEDINE